MAQYSIKDLEKVTGIKAHTIRIWEKRYGIVKPLRSDTNIRSYSDEDLRKLLNISLLNRRGIKISKLAKMTVQDIEEQVIDLAQQTEDSDSKIESLLMAMIDLDEERFLKSLNLSIRAYGFEDTFINILSPFLKKAGVLWMAGTISPAEEHFVSNLIRQKLIAEIDNLIHNVKSDSKRFLLFLPEGEMHELGLLFTSYLIQKNGHEVLYFGQSTPLNSVIQASKRWGADSIIFSLVNSMAVRRMSAYLNDIKLAFPGKKIYANGYQTQFMEMSDLDGIELINDYDTFNTIL